MIAISNCKCGRKKSKVAKICIECFAKEKSIKYKGEGNPSYIDGRMSKKSYCIDCGKSIWRGNRYCHSCAVKGSRNPKWKGDNLLSVEERDEVRKRDNYTCQNCGEYSIVPKLDVHHKDNNPENNQSDNLTTLCHGCHSTVTNNIRHKAEVL